MSIDRGERGRIAIFALLTGAIAFGIGKALLYHSTHISHVGPTSATISDVASVIGGVCLGLALGAMGTALLVRHSSRIVSGLVAGVLGYVVVTPFVWTTFSSDISSADKLGGLVFIAIPALLAVGFGAAIGTAIGAAISPPRANAPG